MKTNRRARENYSREVSAAFKLRDKGKKNVNT